MYVCTSDRWPVYETEKVCLIFSEQWSVIMLVQWLIVGKWNIIREPLECLQVANVIGHWTDLFLVAWNTRGFCDLVGRVGRGR